MGWLDTALNLAPLVTRLVVIAERMWDGKPKSGAEKKQFVHDATVSVLEGADAVTTGGAKSTTDKLKTVLPDFIDAIADGIFVNKYVSK